MNGNLKRNKLIAHILGGRNRCHTLNVLIFACITGRWFLGCSYFTLQWAYHILIVIPSVTNQGQVPVFERFVDFCASPASYQEKFRPFWLIHVYMSFLFLANGCHTEWHFLSVNFLRNRWPCRPETRWLHSLWDSSKSPPWLAPTLI